MRITILTLVDYSIFLIHPKSLTGIFAFSNSYYFRNTAAAYAFYLSAHYRNNTECVPHLHYAFTLIGSSAA